MIAFVRSVLGTVPAQFDFVVYVTAAVLTCLFAALFLRFILGAVSNIFYK